MQTPIVKPRKRNPLLRLVDEIYQGSLDENYPFVDHHLAIVDFAQLFREVMARPKQLDRYAAECLLGTALKAVDRTSDFELAIRALNAAASSYSIEFVERFPYGLCWASKDGRKILARIPSESHDLRDRLLAAIEAVDARWQPFAETMDPRATESATNLG